MIKIELVETEDSHRLELTSNDISADRDLMDDIGNAIISSSPKRGGYSSKGVMVIEVRKDGEE